MADIVSVKNLVKRYGELVALDHFDLRIARGEIFGLLGPNGSGGSSDSTETPIFSRTSVTEW